jgi:hypothetical protein
LGSVRDELDGGGVLFDFALGAILVGRRTGGLGGIGTVRDFGVMSRSSTRQCLAHLPTMEITPRYHVSVSRHISVLNMHNKSNELYMLRAHFQSPEAVNKFGLISGH